jgi:hypothetical protein
MFPSWLDFTWSAALTFLKCQLDQGRCELLNWSDVLIWELLLN